MKKLILAAAVAALASIAIIASASAGVERYQTQFMTITAVQPKNAYNQWTEVWTHTYTVEVSPCDGSFTGTGAAVGTPSAGDPRGFLTNETIAGKLNGKSISYTAAGAGPNSGWPAGFNYSFAGKLGVQGPGTDSLGDAGLEFRVNAVTTGTTSYKNHGEYVSQGGSPDAAHSCIGMPKSGPADSVLGSIVYDNDSFGLASFTFAGQDGGKGTALYADKSGYYLATATDVTVTGPTTATMSLQVTYSAHPAVPVGTQFTVTLHDEPGTRDYFTINNQLGRQFVAKAGNILINYR